MVLDGWYVCECGHDIKEYEPVELGKVIPMKEFIEHKCYTCKKIWKYEEWQEHFDKNHDMGTSGQFSVPVKEVEDDKI